MKKMLASCVCLVSPLSVFAEDEREVVDNIIVEAAKAPVTQAELAARITVVDADQIDRELAQNISDLVRFEPGVDVVDQGSRFGFSGISIRGIGGNRVQVEIDGVPASDAFSIGSFSNAGRDFIDINNIQQVEISRGPASALFGSDALGGVVSFVTQTPQGLLGEDASHLDGSVGYNSVDSSQVLSATGAQRFGAITTMLQVTGRDGSERNTPLVDPLQSDSLNLLAKVGVGDTDTGGVLLTLERFEANNLTEVNSLEGSSDLSALFGFPYLIDTTRVAGDDARSRLRATVSQEWRAGAGPFDYIRWRAFHQESETTQTTFEDRSTLIFGASGEIARERGFVFDQKLQGLELNLASTHEFFGREHSLSYGLEYERADTEQIRTGTETNVLTGETGNTVGPDTFPVRDFPVSRTTRTGIYLQDAIAIGDVTLLPGIRYDRFTLDPSPDAIFLADNPGIESVEIDDARFSPKFGATWQATDTMQLYAQYAEGFRAPPVNDVNIGFTNLQFGYTALPNPDLESESSRGVEAGMRLATDAASYELAVFETRYDDFIESLSVVGFDPILQVLQFQSINLDNVRIRGAEFSGSFQPRRFEGWQIRFAAAYADGENRNTGQPINSIAPLNGVLGLDYLASSDRYGVSAIARGAARQTQLDETQGDLLSPAGYVIYDLTGFWKPTDATRLRFGVFNLTDRAYTPYLDVQGVLVDGPVDARRFQRPGREFNVALDWRF